METFTQEKNWLKDSAFRFKKTEIPAIEVHFDAERDILARYMMEYFKHHFNVTLKNGLFGGSEYKSDGVHIKDIGEQPLDLFIKLAKEDKGCRMYISAIKENDMPLDPLVFESEYTNFRNLVQQFSSQFIANYYKTMYEIIHKEVQDLSRTIRHLETETEDLPYKIAMQRSVIEKLRDEVYQMEKRLRKGTKELTAKKKELEDKAIEVEYLKNKMSSL